MQSSLLQYRVFLAGKIDFFQTKDNEDIRKNVISVNIMSYNRPASPKAGHFYTAILLRRDCLQKYRNLPVLFVKESEATIAYRSIIHLALTVPLYEEWNSI